MTELTALAHADLARRLRDSGDVDNAMHHLNRALELDPACYTARGTRAALAFDHGMLDAAAADWRQVCADRTKRDPDWHRFRIWLCDSRLGRRPRASRDLREWMAEAVLADDWTAKIGSFLVGDVKESELFAATGDDPGRVCEASYWAAAIHSLNGERAQAVELLKRAVLTGMFGYTEWKSAVAELRKLGE